MPTNLSSIVQSVSSSRLKLCLVLLLSPFLINAQTLTGLWIGALSNDSTTVRKDQSFEIVLTEYKGKVYGYSRSEFIVDDVLYYIVKRVEGTIEGEICEVTDDELIACNFPKRPEKGVKVTSVFRRNGTDGEWYLDGTWKTNKTKNYYSITGKVSLAEEKDLTASKIFPHLEELKIADDIAFYKEGKEGIPIVRLVKPERDDMASHINPTFTQVPITVSASPTVETGLTQRTQRSNERNVEIQNPKPLKTMEGEHTNVAPPPLSTAARNNTPDQKTITKNEETLAENSLPERRIDRTYTPTDNSVTINTETKGKPSGSSSVKLETKTVSIPEPVAVTTNTSTPEPEPAFNEEMNVDLKKLRQSQVATNNNPSPQKNIQAVEKKEPTTVKIESKKEAPIYVAPIPKVNTTPAEREGAAMAVNERRTEVSQVVNFRSDSLQIALYDNGQIDGDTVSVLMNGEVILSRQGLKATAIKHTIYLAPGVEEFNIVLYAENLGTLPPNTGLVVVRDGTDVYNLRFSADYQKNTGIVFRRKK